jgi:macrolide transport system ATP-binding/permease protein
MCEMSVQGYFNLLHTQTLAGRYFSDGDDTSKPRVLLINGAFARTYFANEDLEGKQIGDPALNATSMKQIVGVVEDFKDASLYEEQRPAAIIRTARMHGPTIIWWYVHLRTRVRSYPPLLPAIHLLDANVRVE